MRIIYHGSDPFNPCLIKGMAARQRLYNSLISLLNSGDKRKVILFYCVYRSAPTIGLFPVYSPNYAIKIKTEIIMGNQRVDLFTRNLYKSKLIEVLRRYLKRYEFNAINLYIYIYKWQL